MTIKEAADHQPIGSFLAQLHEDLDDPAGLGAFHITHKQERRTVSTLRHHWSISCTRTPGSQ